MKVLVMLFTFLSCLPAFADTTLAGVMFGGPPYSNTKPNSAVCYLFNVSPVPVTIKNKWMTAESSGGRYRLTYDSCSSGTIQSGAICAFQATIGNANGGVGCAVILSSSDGISERAVRGELEVRNYFGNVTSNIELK